MKVSLLNISVCDLGYEPSGANGRICNECNVGRYKSVVGNNGCLSCGNGEFTQQTGLYFSAAVWYVLILSLTWVLSLIHVDCQGGEFDEKTKMKSDLEVHRGEYFLELTEVTLHGIRSLFYFSIV